MYSNTGVIFCETVPLILQSLKDIIKWEILWHFDQYFILKVLNRRYNVPPHVRGGKIIPKFELNFIEILAHNFLMEIFARTQQNGPILRLPSLKRVWTIHKGSSFSSIIYIPPTEGFKDGIHQKQNGGGNHQTFSQHKKLKKSKCWITPDISIQLN